MFTNRCYQFVIFIIWIIKAIWLCYFLETGIFFQCLALVLFEDWSVILLHIRSSFLFIFFVLSAVRTCIFIDHYIAICLRKLFFSKNTFRKCHQIVHLRLQLNPMVHHQVFHRWPLLHVMTERVLQPSVHCVFIVLSNIVLCIFSNTMNNYHLTPTTLQ